MKKRVYVLTERATLRRATDYPDQVPAPDEWLLPDDDFDIIKQFAADAPDNTADALLTYSLSRGRDTIRLRTYAGLLDLRGGLSLDIRPRVGYLPNLLRHLPDAAFHRLHTGQTGAMNLPLWEVFIDAFLRETAHALGQGLARNYVAETVETATLRGKIRMTQQARQPYFQPDRLALIQDEHTANIAVNRVLKTALLRVMGRSDVVASQTRCRQLLAFLADIPTSTNLPADLRAIASTNRLLRRYDLALRWATWLLRGQGAGLCVGPTVTNCLLFSMERVFEQYVAAGFRRVGAEVQESSAHLIDEHAGQPKFKLRPDLILRQNGQTIVLDTKWKLLDATDQNGHYGIDQADLYQLYAYGKKYDATQLVLIYPAHAGFTKPLRVFGYDDDMRLHVVPFNLDKPLADEVATVLDEVGGGAFKV
ncbi:restriction endonuclease [Fibrella sp. HMF5335]|uniref:Restriction endonuclease n=1 Tax=Fibrella rubiginis TaxID=2817060 RepID=A0A939GE93_9BACT|nr:restriction endonuclease [Fibrella rubiginis]MBO0937369.1 restriction endonuclease [Fibrella rubiginis]